jgi:hypothetical protein
MDKKNIQAILQDALEHEIPSSSMDLWPAVKDRLVARKDDQQGEKMNNLKSRQMRVSLAFVLVIALVTLALVTPQGRAFAQSILQFFVRAESDAIPVPTSEPLKWVDVTPGISLATKTPLPSMAIFAGECGDFGTPTCSVEQIRSKVDFIVKEPAVLPQGLYFLGATGGPDNISMLYYYEKQRGSLFINIERWAGAPSPETDLIGASANVETVKIGDLLGEYFKGVFVNQDGGASATWDPTFDIETLRWIDAGISYTMSYSYPPTTLGKEGMTAIAESMTIEPVMKQPMPTPQESEIWNPKEIWNLNISEAEEQAGFKLMLPTELPESLSLVGALYEEKQKYVQVYYQTSEGNSLMINQQVSPSPADCILCDISIGDYNDVQEGNLENVMMVPADANLETVQIGSATGEYIEGVWSGTDCCGWVWEPNPYLKTLRWWADGKSFELRFGGMGLEKADMIKIAESMK